MTGARLLSSDPAPLANPTVTKKGVIKRVPLARAAALGWVVHGGLKDYLAATLFLTFVPALCPNPTFAQSSNSGTVTGTVKDPSGAVVAA